MLALESILSYDQGKLLMYCFLTCAMQYAPHPRTDSEWCIYPSYDYAHRIVDSLENITHSVSFALCYGFQIPNLHIDCLQHSIN